MNKNDVLLYVITDQSYLNGKPLDVAVEEAIKGGATFVQLREKNISAESKKELALLVQSVCKRYNVPFVINDDVYLAKEIDADGVHVGQSDMAVSEARKILGPDKIIGATAKTVEQALKAQSEGADYLGSGAVFGTMTKLDAKPMDLSLFNEICDCVSIPVVAIGGITADNLDKLSDTLMSGACFVSGVFAASDITATTALIKEKLLKIIKG